MKCTYCEKESIDQCVYCKAYYCLTHYSLEEDEIGTVYDNDIFTVVKECFKCFCNREFPSQKRKLKK